MKRVAGLCWLGLVLVVQCLEVPLVTLKGEDGREYSTTDYEDQSVAKAELSALNHPRMPFRLPKALEEQSRFFLLNDEIHTKGGGVCHGAKFKGLSAQQYRQVEELF